MSLCDVPSLVALNAADCLLRSSSISRDCDVGDGADDIFRFDDCGVCTADALIRARLPSLDIMLAMTGNARRILLDGEAGHDRARTDAGVDGNNDTIVDTDVDGNDGAIVGTAQFAD